jgi:hypothetical protein
VDVAVRVEAGLAQHDPGEAPGCGVGGVYRQPSAQFDGFGSHASEPAYSQADELHTPPFRRRSPLARRARSPQTLIRPAHGRCLQDDRSGGSGGG